MEKKMLGERIKDKRKSMRLTQQDLSGPTVSRALISLIERNQTKPSLKTLESIADKLGTTVSDLLQEEMEAGQSVGRPDYNYQKVVMMAKALVRSGNLDQAEDVVEKGLQQEESTEGKGVYKKLLGEIYLSKKDYSNALANFEAALFYYSPAEIHEHIEVHYSLAECHRKLNKHHSGIEHALRAITLLRSIHQDPDMVLELKILYTLSYSYCQIKQYASAIKYIEEALRLSERTDIFYKHNQYLVLRGLAFMYLENYAEGIKSTQIALSNFRKTTNFSEIAGCLINLGILYRKNEEYSRSLEHLEKSLVLSREHGLKTYYCNAMYEMCITLHAKGSLPGALQTGKDALMMEDFPVELRGKLLFALGLIQIDLEEYEEALKCLEEAEGSFRDRQDYMNLSRCKFKKSDIYSRLKQYEESQKLLNEGYHELEHLVI
ncbi:tetratricopeptide repeat protein [Halobacillus fulvus]|nr:tetratricopeptide repeat protein [Halobacillus fulvus]